MSDLFATAFDEEDAEPLSGFDLGEDETEEFDEDEELDNEDFVDLAPLYVQDVDNVGLVTI